MNGFFNGLDWLIIVLYLGGIVGLGVWLGRDQRNTRDYFLGSRNLPWWGIGLSIVAAETSALTIIGVPSMAYGGNLMFIQMIIGYVIARIILAVVMVPHYLRGEIYSPYQLFEQRLGKGPRRLAGALFLLLEMLAAGVRTYVACIPIRLMLGDGVCGFGGWVDPILGAILIFVGLSLFYTYIGGVKAVIWTDAVQFGLFLAGGLFALLYIPTLIPGGWSAAIARAGAAGKLAWFNPHFSFSAPFNIWMGVIGGTVLILSSHGAEQLIVQRVLACRTVADGRKALVLSAVLIFPLFLIFLLVGALLWVFYQSHPFQIPLPQARPGITANDFIFPIFMITEVPHVLKGFLIVAILAAAMSSISSAITALASVSTMDFFQPWLRGRRSDAYFLRFSRYSTVFWAAVLVLIAFLTREVAYVLNAAFSLRGLVSGALLGGLILALYGRGVGPKATMAGMVAAVVVMNLIYWEGARVGVDVFWPWFTLIGTVVTLGVAWVAAGAGRRPRLALVAGLVVFLAPAAAATLAPGLGAGLPGSATPATVGPGRSAQPAGVGRFAAVDAAIDEAVAAHRTPGGVIWVQHGEEVYRRAYGHRALVPAPEPATDDTIYDAASLTKVIATTTAVMQLVEQGRIDLTAPVARYLPAFAQNGKEAVTIRQLLTHMSGLRPDLSLTPPWSGYTTGVALAMQEKLTSLPGSTFAYSDINFIVLGEVVRVVGGMPLDAYAARNVFAPLRMRDTGFRPPAALLPRIAPTELTDGHILRGVVHDPTARAMGGVAGHAGLFTTAADLARFCRMLLGRGELEGVRVLRPETVALMTRVQNEGDDRRGLGWDLDSRYSGLRGRWFPAGLSYGHTGFTGTSVWIDPTSDTFWVFLSNRVHPDGKGDIVPLRRTLGTLVAEATGRERGAVLQGIDVLERDEFAPLRGLRIGLITNQSGRDRDGRSTIDLLAGARGVKLVALFSPEHGIRGTEDARTGDSLDAKTHVPIYSLYGAGPPRQPGQSAADHDLAVMRARAPRPEQLRELDAVVIDLQDVGTRFYTYPATVGIALEAAGRAGKKVFVLDRVDPIGGAVEGPVRAAPPNFAGYHPVPVRYGMTLGELARMLNAERGYHADLTVIRCEHWNHRLWFDQTGLPWIDPSPAIRSPAAAGLYPGICLVEGTSLSVGRGTLHPFEQVGAPFIDGARFAAELNAFALEGVRFEPVRFTPLAALYPGPASSLKHCGEECGGVRVIATDRERAAMVDMGVAIALTAQKLYPHDFSAARMAALVGDDATIAAIEAGQSLAEIKALWQPGLADFAARRKSFLLYPER